MSIHFMMEGSICDLAGLVDPGGLRVVGEDAEGVVIAGNHEIAHGLGLGGGGVELVPAAQRGLDLGRVIGAEDGLGDGAAIDEAAGASLPGNALEDALGVGHDVLGVLVHLGHVALGEADVLDDVEGGRRC